MDEETPQSIADEIEVSGLGPWLSPPAHARRLALSAATVLLTLALVFAGIPTLRRDAIALVLAPTPTPTLPSLQGADSFYFLTTPPWVTVLVDGRPLDPVPLADLPLAPSQPVTAFAPDRPTPVPLPAGHPGPLRLARGLHTFEWRGAPFETQRCTLPVPLPFLFTPHDRQACPFLPYLGTPPGYVLQQRELLATLPPGQQSALWSAIADGLNVASSVVIQPGEPYLEPGPASSSLRIVYARAPLRATIEYSLAADSTGSEPCAVASGVQPCRFPGQDCRQLCTATQPASVDPSGANGSAWIVAVPMQVNWELSAFDLAMSDLQGPRPVASLALLRITWDGANWHAMRFFGHTAGAPVSDDAVCAPAREWLANTNGPLLGLPRGPLVSQLDVGIEYVSGQDPTDGCFVTVDPSSFAFAVSTAVQPATFLLRFGVLRAVNAAARQLAPWLPVAGAHEQAIAQHLQTLASSGG